MITIDKAFKLFDSTLDNYFLSTEEIDVINSSGRFLAETPFSRVDIPPFNKSAMDGYAVMEDDIREEYEVIEFIAAGKYPTKALSPGECTRIMTGAPVPEGAGRVIKFEDTDRGEKIVRVLKHSNAKNIAIQGEDIKQGTALLKRGKILDAASVSGLISSGIQRVKVFRKLRAAIIVTGDELVKDAALVRNGRIIDSNGPMLQQLCEKFSLEVVGNEIIRDNRDALMEAMNRLKPLCDILFLTGGVSEGDLDYVPEVFNKTGFKIHFDRLAIKPGKPLTFASITDDDARDHDDVRDQNCSMILSREHSAKFAIGFPGNPVAAFLGFYNFALRAQALLSCGSTSFTPMKMKMGEKFIHKKTDRDRFVPCRINPVGMLERIDYHGSAHLLALSEAHGFAKLTTLMSEVEIGEEVEFYSII